MTAFLLKKYCLQIFAISKFIFIFVENKYFMAKKIVRKKAVKADSMVVNFRVSDIMYKKYVKKYPTFIDRKIVVSSLREHFAKML